MRRSALLLTALVVSASAGDAVAASPLPLRPLSATFGQKPAQLRPAAATPRRVVVVFDDHAGPSKRQSTRAEAGTTVVRSLGSKAYQLLRPEPGQTIAEAIAALRDDPDVEAVQRDQLLHPTAAAPDDLLFGQQWGLRNTGLGINGQAAVSGADINVLAAWDQSYGTSATIVADIDSGYRPEHPDLGPPAAGWDFVGNDADPTDSDLIDGGHGVHTAGIIGATGNNHVGVSGVAPRVTIMPLRVCDRFGCLTSDVVDAINFAAQHGARVANLSLGGDSPDPAIDAAIAANPETLFAIAAGNGVTDDSDPNYGVGVDNDSSSPYRSYPCVPATSPRAVANVICVAATDQADRLASFSNFGRTTVDLGAPGTDVLSTYPTFAAPRFADDFEASTFSSSWTLSPLDGFTRTSEAPLTSWGIASSAGGNPQPPGTTRVATSPAATMPNDSTTTCTLSLQLRVDMASDHELDLGVVENGSYRSLFQLAEPIAGYGTLSFETNVSAHAAVRVRFSYSTQSTQSDPGAGAQIDDVAFSCIAPVGDAGGYAFLDGTSMATPMVSGTAALLFSKIPSATVAQVRNAILQNTDPDASLAGKTVTGGRLNAGRAITALIAAASAPAAPVAPASAAPASAAPTTAVTAKTPARCVVPRMIGNTLRGATRVLKHAHCRLGTVTKPRHGKRLRVKSSSPRAGTRRTAGTKVKLVLAALKTKR